jgi:hypothetical protein
MTKIRSRLPLAAALAVVLVQGCGMMQKRPLRLEQMETRPNTFETVVPRSLVPWGEKDLITGISVFQVVPAEPEGSKVYWRLIAPTPVKAKGFKLVIGEVPDGFTQMIPPPGEVFIPTPGQEYYLAVALKKDSETKWETIKWVAEKPFF